jgi:hypothetical protein
MVPCFADIEVARLWVRDIDIDFLQIQAWNSNGFKHRETFLGSELVSALISQIDQVRLFLAEDLQNSQCAEVYMPEALGERISEGQCFIGLATSVFTSQFKQKPCPHHSIDESGANRTM